MPLYFALFDTAFGCCGLAWGARGIMGVQLPEGTERKTRACLLQRFPGGQEALFSEDAKRARDGIAALLRGERSDLAMVALDMEDVPQFHRRVYEAARQIPQGETATYGTLAERTGAAGAARAVGQALSRNPFPIIVPCHRVVAAGRRIGGFSAHGGITAKLRLLAIEGALQDCVPSLLDSPGFAQKFLRCG